MTSLSKNIKEVIAEAFDHISSGELIISPTKVGYILVASSSPALKKKFEIKNRPLKKSAVILTSHDRLFFISHISKCHIDFINRINDESLLCGFILQRNHNWFETLGDEINRYTMQSDGTSCFVINHGIYSEKLVEKFNEQNQIIFGSSANKSGSGNKGKFSNIGLPITQQVSYFIEDDAYVAKRYKDKEAEQGVMVDLTSDIPTVIRLGLDSKKIIKILSSLYGKSGYIIDHGAYP